LLLLLQLSLMLRLLQLLDLELLNLLLQELSLNALKALKMCAKKLGVSFATHCRATKVFCV